MIFLLKKLIIIFFNLKIFILIKKFIFKLLIIYISRINLIIIIFFLNIFLIIKKKV